MFHLVRPTVSMVLVVCTWVSVALDPWSSMAGASSVVPLYLNAMTSQSDTGQAGWGGFGDFVYGGSTVAASPTLGAFGAFMFDSVGNGGSGHGWNVTQNADAPLDSLAPTPILNINAADFPILDKAAFGTNFNPDDYILEVVYRPGPLNADPVFNITLDTHDGFAPDPVSGVGKRVGQQVQWGFTNIIAYHAANQDASGFATISQGLTNGMGGQTSTFTGPSFLFASGSGTFQSANVLQPTPNDGADFNAFQNLVPNGAIQIHIQSSYDTTQFPGRTQLEIKSIRIRPRNPDPTVKARLDAHSGIGRRFGTAFSSQDETGADVEVLYDVNGDGAANEPAFIRNTDQLRRFDANGFTNLIIDTDDDGDANLSATSGGFGIWQDQTYQKFDGTQASLEIRAKLTAPMGAGQADRIDVVINDLDGNDTGAGMGAEEYRYFIDLNQFNTSTFTTVSIPLADFDQRVGAFETVNAGDEALTNFDLYYLGLLTLPDIGLVDLEVEYIQVVTPSIGLAGDYNDDDVVDAADYTVWRDNLGAADETSLNGNGDGVNGVDAGDYTHWKNNFGAGPGAGGVGGAAVPEPSAAILVALGLGILGVSRRKK